MRTKTIAAWGGVLVVALLVGLAVHVHVNRAHVHVDTKEYHLMLMLRDYRAGGTRSGLSDLFDHIDPTPAGPLQYAYWQRGFLGMDKSELLEMFGRPCRIDISDVDDWINPWDEVPKEYDEVLHYGEDDYLPYHHVGDETENLFFFIHEGKVVYVKTLFP